MVLAVGDEVAVAAGEEPGFELAPRELDFHAGVGRDAPLVRLLGVLEAVNVLSRRPLIGGDGQLEDAVAVLQVDDVLDRPLAIAALADDRGAVVVLETGRDDLGGRGRVLIDQDDHREAVEGPFLLSLVGLGDGVPPLRAHDQSVLDEQVGDFHGRAEEPARVVAEVENQGLHPLALELVEGFFQLLGRVLDEAADSDVADLAVLVEHEVPLVVGLAAVAEDARNINDRAVHRECLGLFLTLVKDRELDGSAGTAGEDLDGLVGVHPFGRLSVDLHDEIARENARLVSRGPDHRRDDLEPVQLGVHADLNADAAETSLDLPLELPPLARVDERRVRVEVLEHPLQRALEQLAAIDGPNVVGLHLLDGVHEDAVKLHHLVLWLGAVAGLPAEQGDRADQGKGEQVPTWHE